MPPKRFDPFEVERDDSPDLKRKKRKAKELLGTITVEMESDGFVMKPKKSTYIFECPECKLVKVLYPAMKSYENGDWDFFSAKATREHRGRNCSRADS